jgi:hypothetical protein
LRGVFPKGSAGSSPAHGTKFKSHFGFAHGSLDDQLGGMLLALQEHGRDFVVERQRSVPGGISRKLRIRSRKHRGENFCEEINGC